MNWVAGEVEEGGGELLAIDCVAIVWIAIDCTAIDWIAIDSIAIVWIANDWVAIDLIAIDWITANAGYVVGADVLVHVLQSMWCKLCGAIYVVKSLRCTLVQSIAIVLIAIDWIAIDWIAID